MKIANPPHRLAQRRRPVSGRAQHLEGAPPLSANWQLLESNDELAQHGMLRLSATLIFALYQSDQIDHRRTKSTPCAAAAATA